MVAPVLAIAALPVLRQSTLAQLLWVSMLGYVVYNYAFYVFGAAFNSVFLLHVAAFSASLFGFVLALAALDPDSIRRHFAIRTPVGWIAGILIVLAAVLGLMWTSLVLQVAFTGQVPPKASSMVLPTAMTHLSWVLDLAVLVPAYLLAGVLLWRRVGWGYVLATVVLVSGFVQQLMYMSALVFQASANVPGASAFDPLEPFITFAYLAGAGLLLLNTKRSAMQTAGTSSSAGSSGQPGRDGGGLSDR